MVTNQEEEDNFVRYSIKPMEVAPEKEHFWYTIWDAKDSWGNRILECGFICPPIQKIVEVWCYTTEQFKNKGYGTEALRGLVRFASAFDIENVCASVKPDNYASKKMLEKSGFRYLADNNDMQVYNQSIKN